MDVWISVFIDAQIVLNHDVLHTSVTSNPSVCYN